MSTAIIASLALAAAASADDVKLHPLEAYSVEYKLEGSQTGTEVYHLADWGRRTATLTDSRMKVFGIESRTHTRTVTDGARITSYDLDKKTGTVTTNPMYDDVVAAVKKGGDPTETGKEMIRAFGFQPTGERATIAGESCEFWSGQLGRTCFTDDGITLQVETSMGGVTIRKVATKVARGDAGSGSVYAPEPGISVTEQPNIEELMKRMKQP
jgi:hypothetical protein